MHHDNVSVKDEERIANEGNFPHLLLKEGSEGNNPHLHFSLHFSSKVDREAVQ